MYGMMKYKETFYGRYTAHNQLFCKTRHFETKYTPNKRKWQTRLYFSLFLIFFFFCAVCSFYTILGYATLNTSSTINSAVRFATLLADSRNRFRGTKGLAKSILLCYNAMYHT